MTWTHPDDVPTTVTRRVYSLRIPGLSQNGYAAVVADVYEDVVTEFLLTLSTRARDTGNLPPSDASPVDAAVAERLGLPAEFVADMMEVWMEEAARIARERQAARKARKEQQ